MRALPLALYAIACPVIRVTKLSLAEGQPARVFELAHFRGLGVYAQPTTHRDTDKLLIPEVRCPHCGAACNARFRRFL